MFAQSGKFLCLVEWLYWAAGGSHVATVAGFYRRINPLSRNIRLETWYIDIVKSISIINPTGHIDFISTISIIYGNTNYNRVELFTNGEQ